MTDRAPAPRSAFRPKQKSGVPTSVMLQLADRCNFACAHCYQVHGKRGELSTAEVKTVLDEMAAAGVLFLTLSGGEVTLRPDFLEVVEYARRLRFAVKVFTNGYLVDDALAAKLADFAVLEVHVSIYATDPTVHDSVTGVPGSYERTMEGVRALRRYGVRVALAMPLMTVNSSSYGDFIAHAESLGCDFVFDPTINVREDGNPCTTALRASEAAVSRLAADPRVAVAMPPGKPPAKNLSARTCAACSGPVVTPDGTIRACAPLPFSLGDISDGLGAAYRSSETVRFLESLTWADFPACRVCDLLDYCARCHANALLEDGDLFGPSASACRMARIRFRQASGTVARPDEPAQGPYAAAHDGSLCVRNYERGSRSIPSFVKSVLVNGRPASVRRVRLPLVPSETVDVSHHNR